MEEFFKELFGDFQGTPAAASLPTKAYGELVDVYGRVLRETTNWMCADTRTGAPVGRLLQQLAGDTDDLSIITVNHDLVIENEIVKRARLRKRWCLTKGYGTFGAALQLTWPRRAPASSLFPDHSVDCDHARPINLYKLHGSLNWYQRMRGTAPTRSALTGSSPQPIRMTRQRMVPPDLRVVGKKASNGRGRSSWATWSITVPPVHEKDAYIRSSLKPVWDEARAALGRADRLIFRGYSLPLLDTGAERLFQRPLNTNRHLSFVEIVDPAPTVLSRYASLAPRMPPHNAALAVVGKDRSRANIERDTGELLRELTLDPTRTSNPAASHPDQSDRAQKHPADATTSRDTCQRGSSQMSMVELFTTGGVSRGGEGVRAFRIGGDQAASP